jgi:hypothetical protein
MSEIQRTNEFSLRIAEIKKNIKKPKERTRALRGTYYSEAMHYIDNAKETLKKAEIDGRFYTDTEYVKIACKTAYSGVLIAMDGYFDLKGLKIKSNETKDVNFYKYNASKINMNVFNYFNAADNILLGCCRHEITDVFIIKKGITCAKELVDYIRPRI